MAHTKTTDNASTATNGFEAKLRLAVDSRNGTGGRLA